MNAPVIAVPKPGFPWLPVVAVATPLLLLFVGAAAFAVGMLVARPAAPVPAATSSGARQQPGPDPRPTQDPPAPPAAAQERPKEQTDFDAAKGLATYRYMTIGLNPSIDQVELRSILQEDPAASDDRYLLIPLRITNVSQVRSIHYDGWAGLVQQASVRDEFGNVCRPVDFGLGVRPAKQIERAVIAPGQYVDDLLVFEPPVPQAQRIILSLPLGRVDVDHGDADRLTFTIPASLFRR